jgi:hypothetical protein
MTAGVLALSLAFLPSTARAQDEVQKLREDLTRLQKQIKDMQAERELDRQLSEQERRVFRQRLQQLEEDVDRLRGRMSTTSRRQFYSDPQATEMGSVVLRNDLDVPATVTINGRSHVVRAGATRTIGDVPVGSVRYTVTAEGFGVGSPRYSRVSAADPLTIRIYDNRRFDR